LRGGRAGEWVDGRLRHIVQIGPYRPVDRDECCGETANVSPLKAEEPEEVRRIDEGLPCLTEAGLAAELAPDGGGLGKVAGGVSGGPQCTARNSSQKTDELR
jgi:hypothetical protein